VQRQSLSFAPDDARPQAKKPFYIAANPTQGILARVERLIEGDQNLGLLAGEKAVREDGALEAAQVAEADAVAFQGLVTKSRREALMG
jgi:hypothetical protein